MHPHVDPIDQSFDRNIYSKQTMRHDKKDERLLLTANHTCILQVARAHANHLGYQRKGSHSMWITHYVGLMLYVGTYIGSILFDQEVKKGHIVSTCQLHVIAKKCKRHCETFLRSNEGDKEVKRGFDGKMLDLSEKFCLRESAASLGPDLQGWSLDDTRFQTAPFCYILLYIAEWKFRCSMRQAIANGGPDPR